MYHHHDITSFIRLHLLFLQSSYRVFDTNLTSGQRMCQVLLQHGACGIILAT